jgi:hypothetical protein
MPILGSSASPKGVPGVPTIDSVTDGGTGTTVSIAFTAPSFSKLPITSYTVTASPGGASETGASSPITVSGLTAGTAYTFTVRASHANGQSSASSASNSITPAVPVTYHQFTSSGSWTPSSYPATYRAYVLGGGGAIGNYGLSATDNSEAFGGGGGGGGGYFTTSNLVTINSGSVSVVIGNGATATGGNGGASSVGSVNAAGGSAGGGGGAGNGGGGGAGGSGGGGGCGYVLNYTNGFSKRVTAGLGGTNGGAGAGGDAGGGPGSGVAQSPSGGSGGEGGLSVENPAYNGFTVDSQTFGAGQGKGGGYASPGQRPAGSGYALIVRNS